jgi:hypothetical protein
MKEHWEIYLEMQLNLNGTGNEGTFEDLFGNAIESECYW